MEAAGLEVWLDKRRLEAGDDWDQKIRRNVDNCSLFVPIVSRATESRLEGYFRREWARAADRAQGIANEIPFIVPVTVDDTPAYTAKVPERFKRTQFTRPRGRPGHGRIRRASEAIGARLSSAAARGLTMAEATRTRLNPENPWPGLDWFAEGDAEYFHGRDTETAEVLRLLRRESLTVLFGRSGLGKTSLLNAGMFPVLRQEGFVPVYIRLDFSGLGPPLRTQILDRLLAECRERRIESPPPSDAETLWEYFHRTEAEFWNERNRPVTPVLAFDQFEEAFTRGQEDNLARSRAREFLAGWET